MSAQGAASAVGSMANLPKLLASSSQVNGILIFRKGFGVRHPGYSPAFRLASMKDVRSPPRTLLGSPRSMPVRRSLMRDWSRT